MKIRSDFVTNSSSSSFVIAFKDLEDKEVQKEYMKNHYPEFVNQVFNDINKHNMSKDDVVRYFKEHAHWIAYFDIIYGPEARRKGYEWRHSKTCEKMVEKRENEIVEDFIKSLDGNTIFSIVSYSDDMYSELEHHIMPSVPFVVEVINNH